MKKSILGLVVSSLFVMGAAHAEVNPNDTSAVLTVTGMVTAAPESSCQVNLEHTYVTLDGEIDTLATQGANLTDPQKFVGVSLSGDDGKCANMSKEGKIAYKLNGTGDSVEGSVLANTMTGTGAAQGVGIGLYNAAGNIVNVNSSLTADASGMTQLGFNLVKLNGQNVAAGNVQGTLTIQVERL